MTTDDELMQRSSDEERSQWMEILRRLDEGGNDGADVYEAEEFLKQMREKYA